MLFDLIPTDLPITTALAILMLLLPGFLALRIRDGIAETRKRSANEAWLPALLFDLPIYLILLGIAKVKTFGLTPTLSGKDFNPMTVLAALAIAVAVGVIVGVLDEKRIIRSFLVVTGISRKGWRNAWADSFRAARGCYANVRLKDGTELYGWPKFYSAGPESCMIFLARRGPQRDQVSIRQPGEKAKEFEIEGPGVLITPEAEITFVEFVDPA